MRLFGVYARIYLVLCVLSGVALVRLFFSSILLIFYTFFYNQHCNRSTSFVPVFSILHILFAYYYNLIKIVFLNIFCILITHYCHYRVQCWVTQATSGDRIMLIKIYYLQTS